MTLAVEWNVEALIQSILQVMLMRCFVLMVYNAYLITIGVMISPIVSMDQMKLTAQIVCIFVFAL